MVKHEIKKLTHYEYWSWWIYYLPLIPLFLWYSLKAKSLLYFTTVNPSMKYGGLFNYSKYKIQKQIPASYRPQHQLIPKGSDSSKPIDLKFPLVAKPDHGERGRDVQIIKNQKQLNKYLQYIDSDVLLQSLVDKPQEYGLFYYRLPNETQGKIISITGKKFLTFTGDGNTSLREFIESDSRAYFNKSYLYMKFHDKQELVLPEGEELLLEPIGNHNRGTYFYDASHLITKTLIEKLDQLAHGIEGFYYGRFDVKAENSESLQNGDFIVLEVNGANSEATHIFDKNISLVQSYKEVIRHLDAQYRVAKLNIQNGIKPDKYRSFLSDFYKFTQKNRV